MKWLVLNQQEFLIKMIKREVHIFLTAIMFYTRIPCPIWVDHRPDYINASTRYFPVVGWMVGSVYSGVILLLMPLFSPVVTVLIALVVSVLLTGAFHEDGFADMCDGFGGGWTKEKILAIMKDSRIGTYGVVGLILLLSVKVLITIDLIYSLDNNLIFVLAIISSHSLSRMMGVMVIFFQPYARDENDQSKAKPVASGINKLDLSAAALLALVPFVILIIVTKNSLALSLLPMILAAACLMRYFKKWIGGYTGDCLGAVQQVSEVVFLLSLFIAWKFI